MPRGSSPRCHSCVRRGAARAERPCQQAPRAKNGAIDAPFSRNCLVIRLDRRVYGTCSAYCPDCPDGCRRTTRAWPYRVHLGQILERKQINTVRAMLGHRCLCVMRSKVGAMKEVAKMIRTCLEALWLGRKRARPIDFFIGPDQ